MTYLIYNPETGNNIGHVKLPDNHPLHGSAKLERIAAAFVDALPHGSGINYTWVVSFEPDPDDPRLLAMAGYNRYDCLDHVAGYAGVALNFSVSLKLDDELDLLTSPYGAVECTIETLDDIGELQRESNEAYGLDPDDETEQEYRGPDVAGDMEYLADILYEAVHEWYLRLYRDGDILKLNLDTEA